MRPPSLFLAVPAGSPCRSPHRALLVTLHCDLYCAAGATGVGVLRKGRH